MSEFLKNDIMNDDTFDSTLMLSQFRQFIKMNKQKLGLSNNSQQESNVKNDVRKKIDFDMNVSQLSDFETLGYKQQNKENYSVNHFVSFNDIKSSDMIMSNKSLSNIPQDMWKNSFMDQKMKTSNQSYQNKNEGLIFKQSDNFKSSNVLNQLDEPKQCNQSRQQDFQKQSEMTKQSLIFKNQIDMMKASNQYLQKHINTTQDITNQVFISQNQDMNQQMFQHSEESFNQFNIKQSQQLRQNNKSQTQNILQENFQKLDQLKMLNPILQTSPPQYMAKKCLSPKNQSLMTIQQNEQYLNSNIFVSQKTSNIEINDDEEEFSYDNMLLSTSNQAKCSQQSIDLISFQNNVLQSTPVITKSCTPVKLQSFHIMQPKTIVNSPMITQQPKLKQLNVRMLLLHDIFEVADSIQTFKKQIKNQNLQIGSIEKVQYQSNYDYFVYSNDQKAYFNQFKGIRKIPITKSMPPENLILFHMVNESFIMMLQTNHEFFQIIQLQIQIKQIYFKQDQYSSPLKSASPQKKHQQQNIQQGFNLIKVQEFDIKQSQTLSQKQSQEILKQSQDYFKNSQQSFCCNQTQIQQTINQIETQPLVTNKVIDDSITDVSEISNFSFDNQPKNNDLNNLSFEKQPSQYSPQIEQIFFQAKSQQEIFDLEEDDNNQSDQKNVSFDISHKPNKLQVNQQNVFSKPTKGIIKTPKKDDTFTDFDKQILINGKMFKKYGQNDWFKPSTRFVYFTIDLDCLCWCETSTSNTKKLYFTKDILGIENGRSTKNFKRFSGNNNQEKQDLSFSILLIHRSIDLEAKSIQDKNEFCRALNKLLINRKLK